MVWVIGIPPFLRTLAFAAAKSIPYFYFHKNLVITSVKIESTTKHLQNAPMLTLVWFFYNKKIVVFLLSCQLENPLNPFSVYVNKLLKLDNHSIFASYSPPKDY